MTIIVPITLQAITVEETTMVTAIALIIIGIEVKVLIHSNLALKILLLIGTIVLTVLDHLDQIIIVHVIDLAALITNNAIPIIGKIVMTITDNQVVESDLQIAITVETLA
jgi:hypothetical protein